MSAPLAVWRRRALIVSLSGAFLAGNLAFFLWYRSTARLRAGGLELERSALAADTAAKEKEAARLQGQRDRIVQVSQAVQEFYGKRVGRRRESLAPIVDEMHDVFRKTGVFPLQISYATRSVESLALTEMLVSFGYSTDYPTFKKLLAAIEGDRHWIVVRQVGVTRDATTPSAVQMRMVLATYFSADEGETAPKRAPLRPARPASGAARETGS